MADWDGSLETGDVLVDAQHRRIHQLVQDLENAADTPAEIMRVLDRLTAHVAEHFATEEKLMSREEFAPEAAELHRLEHVRLIEDTRDFVLRFRVGTLNSIRPLADFLREWLGDHVETRDRVLIDHVRARGGEAGTSQGPPQSPGGGPSGCCSTSTSDDTCRNRRDRNA